MIEKVFDNLHKRQVLGFSSFSGEPSVVMTGWASIPSLTYEAVALHGTCHHFLCPLEQYHYVGMSVSNVIVDERQRDGIGQDNILSGPLQLGLDVSSQRGLLLGFILMAWFPNDTFRNKKMLSPLSFWQTIFLQTWHHAEPPFMEWCVIQCHHQLQQFMTHCLCRITRENKKPS